MTDEADKLRELAAGIRRIADRQWGTKASADSAHYAAGLLESKARELSEVEPVTNRYSIQACACCKKKVRIGVTKDAPAGYLMAKALTLTAQIHGGASETRRYCPECALVMQDALMELGFVFETEVPPTTEK